MKLLRRIFVTIALIWFLLLMVLCYFENDLVIIVKNIGLYISYIIVCNIFIDKDV